jgi:hypothetical protein
MIVLYADDAGIMVPMIELINEFIDGLKAKGFELMKEGSFSDFLGIKFEENTLAGSITMTQTGLIKNGKLQSQLGTSCQGGTQN